MGKEYQGQRTSSDRPGLSNLAEEMTGCHTQADHHQRCILRGHPMMTHTKNPGAKMRRDLDTSCILPATSLWSVLLCALFPLLQLLDEGLNVGSGLLLRVAAQVV